MTENSITPSRDIARLLEIMVALRTPVTGCPWDLAQTFATIAPYTLEEAYEVADAIERGDLGDLNDELGDLLLQVVYHARMGEEAGAFDFGDVVQGITAKMIRRHPHVFAGAAAATPSDVNGLWDRIKASERAEKPKSASLLADVPVALPALTRAIKLQNKAAKVGFDWPSIAPVFEKLKEEIAEFETAASGRLDEGEPDAADAPSGRLREAESEGANKKESDAAMERIPDAAMKEEFGDMLFVMANIARHLNIDPEAALRAANEKFMRRFRHIEKRLAEKNSSPAQSTLAEMDAFWDEAKAIDKG